MEKKKRTYEEEEQDEIDLIKKPYELHINQGKLQILEK